MAFPTLTNGKVAAGKNCDDLGFVLTTTRLYPGKDNHREFVHPHVAQFKPR